METTIFENNILKVRVNTSKLYEAKSITCIVTAINPTDGKIYTKGSGWISRTYTLHSTKASNYIFNTAVEELRKNKTTIIDKINKLDPGRIKLPEIETEFIDSFEKYTIHKFGKDTTGPKTKIGR